MSESATARRKRSFRGVGIGCGVLALAAAIAAAGVLWFESKVADVIETPDEVAVHLQAVEALDRKYSGALPSEHERLDRARVEAFLALREELLPIYVEYVEASRPLEQPAREGGIRSGIEAAGKTRKLVRRLREAFVTAADARGMSPAEFSELARIVYGVYWPLRTEARFGERKVIERTIAALDEQIASGALSEKERAFAQTQRANLRAQLEGLPRFEFERPPTPPILGSNVTLLNEFHARIERLGMPALEQLLFSDRYREAAEAPDGGQP